MLDNSTFQRISDFVYERSGIVLGPKKDALVRKRVSDRMRELNLTSCREYFDYVEGEPSGRETIILLDSICTNVTSFFRERPHFDALAKHFLSQVDLGQTRFRYWSAACSSGEEACSMAMTLLEAAEERRISGLDVKILGTDLSTKILARAQAGRYGAGSVNAIPDRLREKYFSKSSGGEWVVQDCIRELTTFRRMNLSATRFPVRGPFDSILCRNVMIYFSEEVRQRLVSQFECLLGPGGLLMVGHTESATGYVNQLVYSQPSVYCKPVGDESECATRTQELEVAR